VILNSISSFYAVALMLTAAKNQALEETISDMRGASDSSTSEASRHAMELKQVRVHRAVMSLMSQRLCIV
jgi:hypothetical protein